MYCSNCGAEVKGKFCTKCGTKSTNSEVTEEIIDIPISNSNTETKQKKKKVWNKVLELPIHVQINGGAVINRRRRRFVLQFLKKNPKVVLGSDSHNTTTRKPNLKEARMILADKFGKKVLTKIDNYGKKLLELE